MPPPAPQLTQVPPPPTTAPPPASAPATPYVSLQSGHSSLYTGASNTVSGKRQLLQQPTLVHDFVDAHLRPCSTFSLEDRKKMGDALLTLKGRIKEPEQREATSTNPPRRHRWSSALCDLLNQISDCAYDATVRSNVYGGDPIYFFDHSEAPPTHHPWHKSMRYTSKPDLLGSSKAVFEKYTQRPDAKTVKGNYHLFPWHHVYTIAEIHSGNQPSKEAEAQTSTYISDVLQSRPELIGVYGLYAYKQYYSILWADWSGPFKSHLYSWDDVEPLKRYIWSLYCPPNDHSHHDTSMSLVTHEGVFVSEAPLWKFDSFGQRKFRCVFASSPYSRGTTVFEEVVETDDEAPFVIKDVYHRDRERRDDEAAYIKQVHHLKGKPSPIPGLVRGVNLAALTATTSHFQQTMPRYKSRMLYFDSGVCIDRSTHARQFLVSMFDTVEVHRIAVDRQILHRDLSPGNVYCQPKFMSNEKIRSLGNDVVSLENKRWLTAPWGPFTCYSKFRKGDDELPTCLLADFHLATHFPAANEEDLRGLQIRTGTALYIACAVHQGSYMKRAFPMVESDPNLHLPHICDTLRTMYTNCFGAEQEEFDLITAIRSNLKYQPLPSYTCVHQPRHDMESVFWMITLFLMRSVPLSPPTVAVDETLHNFHTEICDLVHYASNSGTGGKKRHGFLEYSVEEYRRILHVGNQKFAELIHNLAKQVWPEWEFYNLPEPNDQNTSSPKVVRTSPNTAAERPDADKCAVVDTLIDQPTHVHEAFRRIVLLQLDGLEDESNNIHFSYQHQRQIPGPDQSASIGAAGRLGLGNHELKKRSGGSKRSRDEVHNDANDKTSASKRLG